MRAITAVIDGPNENVAKVTVRILNAPGCVVEQWTIHRKAPARAHQPAVYEVTQREDSRGRRVGWSVEADTLASAFDICLVGRYEDREEDDHG